MAKKISYNKGAEPWISSFFDTPDAEVPEGLVEDFGNFIAQGFNESEIKERLCGRIKQIFENQDIGLLSGRRLYEKRIVPEFDEEYFREGTAGYNQLMYFRDATPNIGINNIRSKNIEGVISPVGIFPNTYLNKGTHTKIYILNGYRGDMVGSEIINYFEWTKNISTPMITAFAEEYQNLFNKYSENHEGIKEKNISLVRPRPSISLVAKETGTIHRYIGADGEPVEDKKIIKTTYKTPIKL